LLPQVAQFDLSTLSTTQRRAALAKVKLVNCGPGIPIVVPRGSLDDALLCARDILGTKDDGGPADAFIRERVRHRVAHAPPVLCVIKEHSAVAFYRGSGISLAAQPMGGHVAAEEEGGAGQYQHARDSSFAMARELLEEDTFGEEALLYGEPPSSIVCAVRKITPSLGGF
jgi:hypothetical protein